MTTVKMGATSLSNGCTKVTTPRLASTPKVKPRERGEVRKVLCKRSITPIRVITTFLVGGWEGGSN